MTGTLLRAVLSAGLLAGLAGCGTLSVRADTSAAADLNACHTFSWIETPLVAPTPFGNPLNDKRLHDAVAQRLQSRGMTLVAMGRGDCLSSVSWNPDAPWFRARRIAVDLFRNDSGPAGRQALWHASVDVDIRQLTGAEAEKRIATAVAAMFKTLPTTR